MGYKSLCSMVLVMALATPCSAQVTINSFVLTDQNDIRHNIEFPASKNRIIVVANSSTASQAKRWGGPLRKELGNQVGYVAIAAIGDIPKWQRGFVKAMIPASPPRLLDLDNKVSNLWHPKSDQCLVLWVDKDGAIKGRVDGDYTPFKLNQLLGFIPTPDFQISAIPTPTITDSSPESQQ